MKRESPEKPAIPAAPTTPSRSVAVPSTIFQSSPDPSTTQTESPRPQLPTKAPASRSSTSTQGPPSVVTISWQAQMPANLVPAAFSLVDTKSGPSTGGETATIFSGTAPY